MLSRLKPLLRRVKNKAVRVARSRRFALPRRKSDKPRILLLVDKRRWAFDYCARPIARLLRDDFSFDIRYVQETPHLKANDYDLLYVFFWGEDYYKQFGFDADRVIKRLTSHRWQDDPLYGPLTPPQFVNKYLRDAAAVSCTSLRLQGLVEGLHPRLYHTPSGIDAEQFKPLQVRSGAMTIGWAGNINDAVKCIPDILLPACGDRFKLEMAPGNVSHDKMNEFYNRLDVFAVASRNEGEPNTLIEAMAAGCFPVCTDVGIVPELMRSGENGLIVKERTPQAFREAFEWCESHLDQVRAAGLKNAQQMHRERKWEVIVPNYKKLFDEALAFSRRPRFRNDDVSGDTDFANFERFCRVFWKYGYTQVHGITLNGRTNTLFLQEGDGVEYEGEKSIAHLPNDRIRELSRDVRFEDRADLIGFINESPDEVALHGLYHTDYEKMTPQEQRRDMEEGLQALKKLFPDKNIRYFIAPFNRTNSDTYLVARELGLEVLAASGVHLEDRIQNLTLASSTWHRYHHHRFYPESRFNYYDLSLEILDAALCPKEIALPLEAVQSAIQKHQAQPWFVYAFTHRAERWNICEPSCWLANRLPCDAPILETGCGCALNLIWFGQRGFRSLYGTDNDPKALAAGVDLCALAQAPVFLWEDDSLQPQHLPREDFGAILALNWTYHAEPFELLAFLQSYKKHLTPDGTIVIDVIDKAYNEIPNNQFLTSDWSKPEDQRQPTEYKKRYSRREVEDAVHAAEMTIVKIMSRPSTIPKDVYIISR